VASPEIDPNTFIWQEVHRALSEEIEKHRNMLEQPGVSEMKTELLRGIIKAHRYTLSLADPKSGETG